MARLVDDCVAEMHRGNDMSLVNSVSEANKEHYIACRYYYY